MRALPLLVDAVDAIHSIRGAILEFKSSAGIFAFGFVLSFVGYGLGIIFAMMSASAASSYYSGSSAVVPGVLAGICFLTALIGSIMSVIGAYRALVKIDALPVPVTPAAETVAVPAAPTQTPTHSHP
jgi:hypothetical protein